MEEFQINKKPRIIIVILLILTVVLFLIKILNTTTNNNNTSSTLKNNILNNTGDPKKNNISSNDNALSQEMDKETNFCEDELKAKKLVNKLIIAEWEYDYDDSAELVEKQKEKKQYVTQEIYEKIYMKVYSIDNMKILSKVKDSNIYVIQKDETNITFFATIYTSYYMNYDVVNNKMIYKFTTSKKSNEWTIVGFDYISCESYIDDNVTSESVSKNIENNKTEEEIIKNLVNNFINAEFEYTNEDRIDKQKEEKKYVSYDLYNKMYPNIDEYNDENTQKNTKIYSSTIKSKKMYLTNTNDKVMILCFIDAERKNNSKINTINSTYEFTIKKFNNGYFITNIDMFNIEKNNN